METKKRTKYYPINLKDEQLHNDFMVEKQKKRFKNADQMVKYLLTLKAENDFLEKRCTQKEDDFNELLKLLAGKNDKIEELERELQRLEGEENNESA
ncbi:MAG: hypothetical protein ABFD07_06130 [Methanobacterium sp.]